MKISKVTDHAALTFTEPVSHEKESESEIRRLIDREGSE